MKKILLLSTLALFFFKVFGQSIAINSTGASPLTSAMLDISSTSKGLLIPRMNTLQRVMIISPAQGLLVYDTDTHSFWFNDGGWNQITTGGGSNGPASGDLSGSYPSPTVSKIQNLDVVFGVPFDHQVLKWDALSNNWKGRNDSLFLPYKATYGDTGALFSIRNNNSTNGASAIRGRRGNGSGITPGTTMGVWGDNVNGLGVVGTSYTGVGTYGLSFGNHGVYGYSTLAGFAGVKGSHANAGGIGVMGEVQNSGYGVLGLSFGDSGKAGSFQTSSPTNTDTTLTVSTQGLGILSQFNIANATNNKPAIDIYHNGIGAGLKVRLNQANSSANGIDAIIQGTGIAVYGKSELGVPGKFEITNAANSYPALMVGTNGLGTSLYVNSNNTGVTGNVVDILGQGYGTGLSVLTNYGKAGVFSVTNPAAFNETLNVSTSGNSKNAIFKSNNASSFETNVFVEQNGNGRGIEVNLTKAANTFAGITVNTAGNKGVEVISAGLWGVTASATANGSVAINGNTGQTADNAIGVRGATGVNVNNGIGVLGEAGTNDSNGIGVKGIASSTGSDKGAVTGINNSTGIGVYGEVTAAAGYAISGICGQSNLDAHAAKFENKFNNSTSENVSILTNGKGINLYMNNTNATSTQPQLRMVHAGTGNFMQFEASPGDIKTSLAKSGNFKTSGTVTVKNDKGIVRSSTTSQLRVEVVQAFWDAAGSSETLSPLEVRDVIVTFSTAFSSPPAVYVANLLSGANADEMLTTVINVTTTGCTLHFLNPHSQNISVFDSTWNLVAMGAE